MEDFAAHCREMASRGPDAVLWTQLADEIAAYLCGDEIDEQLRLFIEEG